MALVVDPDLLADSAADDASQEVYINTSAKTIKLVIVGNLSADGVTEKCVYSFLKEQWKNDPNTKNLAAFPFPMTPITDEFYELTDGWNWAATATRNLIRQGGWIVRNTSGNMTEHWAGIQIIGTSEANDQLYYDQGAGATNFVYTGETSEAVQIRSDPNGDGNYVDGYDRSTQFDVFNREYDQLYSFADLTAIGAANLLAPKVFSFALNTSADLKVSHDDTAVSTTSPYTQIKAWFFATAFSRDVDSATDRNFGIVVSVGTHPGVDGSMTLSGSTLTSAIGGIPIDGTYNGGTLTVHEGTNAGTYTIGTITVATQVPITTTFPATESNASFTLQRASPVVATAEEIYEKIQYLQRQASNINSVSGGTSVTGKTSRTLLDFVGDTLRAGAGAPTNPAGGGTGVIIEGFKASDTNRITFYDNTGTARTYPYVASLTINFGDNLKNDTNAKYWVYFTTLPGAGDDYGEAGALIIDDNSGLDMAGTVGGASSVEKSFNYDGNVQGGRTAGTDAAFTAVGIGLSTGQYVKAAGTIYRSTSNSVTLTAALERNYSNP
jgi:hypothetical protein